MKDAKESTEEQSFLAKAVTFDGLLFAAIIALVAFGIVMVFSASSVFASRTYGSSTYFLVRQSVFAVGGILAMVVAASIDYRRYARFTYVILFGSVALLVIVAIGFGHRAGGAARWIALGPIHIQPAEVAKLALIFWMAYSLSRKRDFMRTFKVGFLPHALMAGVLMILCLKQPDFGSAVMIGLLTFILLFTAGAKTGYLLGALLGALPVVYLLVAGSEYRMKRIHAFLEPFQYRYDIGYQISESLMSFGAGGVTGVGLGDSKQKLFFLPEAHTDFIGPIIGEELGLIGILCLIALFSWIVYRGVRIAFAARTDYGAYLAIGVTCFIGIQAFTNLAVAMGMVPTKGLVLPFISYGGSALIVNCAAVGVLLSVSRDRFVKTINLDEEVSEASTVDNIGFQPTGRTSGGYV